MEAIFTLAKSLEKHDVNDIVKLLQDGLLKGPGKEEYARSLFKGVQKVEYEQFISAMTQFCKKYGNTMEEMTEMLMKNAPPVLREFNSDRDIPHPHTSTCSTETETELSNESFHC